MKRTNWILLVAFLGLVFGQMGSALKYEEHCFMFENSIPSIQIASFPQFDPNLGTLTRVKVTVDASACQSFAIDAEDFWSAHTIVHLDTTVSSGEQFTLVPLEIWRNEFGSYNDFVCGNDSDEFIYDDPADLAAWTGSGNVDIITEAVDDTTIDASGSVDARISGDAGETICVAYEYIPLLCINGSKINDCTGEGIPGWEVCLTKPDGEMICTTTDENGDYSFCELESGDYTVCEETRDGWLPKGPICIDVTLVDESAEGVEFLNEPLFCISGHKYNSKTDAGVSGWLITLKDDSGAVLDQKQTGTGGYYEFCGLESGDYTVCEELKSGWKRVGPECIDVTLECANSEDNDFENKPGPNPPCRNGCPWFIKNELYTASCQEVKEVDLSKGILANDPAGSIVADPESITIDPKYGTIEVHEDGSFVYDPAGAAGLNPGAYVVFTYNANNGRCDAKYPGIAKIQIRC